MKPKIVFIGTPNFADIILKELIENNLEPSLVITNKDKPKGRKGTISSPPVKLTAEKNKIPILQPEKITEAKKDIEKIHPDIIILAAYGQIIPEQILNIPKYGTLNVHPSLLPKYRGASPIQSAILKGESETGVTIILANKELDKGPVVSSLIFKIQNPRITNKELEEQLASFGANLLINTIPKWIKGDIKPREQDESKKTYTQILKKEDGRIDWTKNANQIEKKVRAFNPWPTTYCKAKNQTMKIWKAFVTKQTETSPKGPPGKVYLATNNNLAVQCGKDYLTIEELQFEGKRRMTAEEFLKGNIDFIGTILK